MQNYLKVHERSSFRIFRCDITEATYESFGFDMIFRVILVDVHVIYQAPVKSDSILRFY